LTLDEVLRVWERGEGQSAAARALTLLSCARPEASASALTSATIGEREAAVLGLRIRLFGRELELMDTCPACGITIEFGVDAGSVLPDQAAAPALSAAEPQVVEQVLEIDGWRVVFRVPTAGDLLAVEQAGALPVPAVRQLLLDRCVLEAQTDGASAAATAMPDAIQQRVAAAMERLDPAADISIDLTCPECRHAWRMPLDVCGLFWTELRALARRLLSDVDELASRYGWTESEILGLSARRRRAYIERVWE
jgi:hypothetical protein